MINGKKNKIKKCILNMKNKLSVYSILIFIIFILFKNVFGQDLIIELYPKKINENTFNGNINLKIKNNTNETVFISLEPFNCKVIKNSHDWLVNMLSDTYSPNRIILFKNPQENYSEGVGKSFITYLKFPKILYLEPSKVVNLILIFNEKLIEEIENYNWNVVREIWYAFKKDIDNILEDKTELLKDEFNNSLIFNDTININLISENQILPDSTLFYYRDRSVYSEETVYNSIIERFILYSGSYIINEN